MTDPTVETTSGRVRGQTRHGVYSFKGIPFAAPPTGRRRWTAPQPVEPWSGTRDALEFGPAAPQDTTPLMNVGPTDEDCLSLNVWTTDPSGRKPVMVWIHGGGFLIGASRQREYSGARLAVNGDVVVVSINYRLGAIGFADLPWLRDRDDYAANRGLLDQLFALEWVQENIERFGGDPQNVTIFGESAGGMSVATLLATDAAGRLFHAAIPQSGATFHTIRRDQADLVAARFADKLANGAAITPDLFDNAPVEQILAAQRRCATVAVSTGPWNLPMRGMNFLPVHGDDLLPDDPQRRIEAGAAAPVPLLTGTTRDEWALFSVAAKMAPPEQRGTAMVPGLLDDAQLADYFEANVPGHGAALLAGYRTLYPDAGADELGVMLETDRLFFVPATRMATACASQGRDVQVYRFDWRSPIFGGAAHAIDVPFVFGGVDEPFGKMFTGGGTDAAALSAIVQQAWTRFAYDSHAAAEGLPDWLAYDAATRSTMIFDREPRLETQPWQERLALWEEVR
ncbi:MAG: carboxylesterase/lipase family protein [Candidatus Dadabacteria bacterium]|nr:MAG: carboxylesterase/lipase family protein [Candidatus Dadabacteria bacterium]